MHGLCTYLDDDDNSGLVRLRRVMRYALIIKLKHDAPEMINDLVE